MATNFMKLSDAPIKGSVDLTNDYITTVSGTSVYRTNAQTLINKAKENALTAWEEQWLDSLTDGMFYVYEHHTDSDHYKVKMKASQYAQRTSETLIGVCFPMLDREIVVAPQTIALPWSNGNNARVGSIVLKANAVKDFDGKDKTAAIVAALGSGTDYAAGYCNAYSRTNAYGEGILAGSWWLPTFGEMVKICDQRNKINVMLGLKPDVSQIPLSSYQTSTETSDQKYYTYSAEYGTLTPRLKHSTYRVLPITSYW